MTVVLEATYSYLESKAREVEPPKLHPSQHQIVQLNMTIAPRLRHAA